MSRKRKCGKKTYRKGSDAVLSAAQQMARGAPLLSAYECPQCRGWHITKMVDRTVEKARAGHPSEGEEVDHEDR